MARSKGAPPSLRKRLKAKPKWKRLLLLFPRNAVFVTWKCAVLGMNETQWWKEMRWLWGISTIDTWKLDDFDFLGKMKRLGERKNPPKESAGFRVGDLVEADMKGTQRRIHGHVRRILPGGMLQVEGWSSLWHLRRGDPAGIFTVNPGRAYHTVQWPQPKTKETTCR